jgi:hypothetical protein
MRNVDWIVIALTVAYVLLVAFAPWGMGWTTKSIKVYGRGGLPLLTLLDAVERITYPDLKLDLHVAS